ncbi:MAG: hypothetical protein JRG91_15805 [Deltaproteobacteria bacterium]|nr:hypothetical protein [Deltaproteobacteria bacterium]
MEAEVLTDARLQEALEIQRESSSRLGTVLIQQGFITEPQLIQALSKQLSIPWVSLWHLDISEQLLDMIPEEVVLEHGVLPIYVRSLKGGDKALYVAMDNPADTDLLEKISETCGLTVKPMIAGPSEIASAILDYYGTGWKGAPSPPPERTVSSVPPPPQPREEKEEEESLLLTEAVEEEEEAAAKSEEASPPGEEGGEPAAEVTSEERDLFAPETRAREPARPQKKRGFKRGSINLTFLDGTSIAVSGKDAEKKRARESASTMEERIDDALTSTGGGDELALAVKGILKTLMRRGLLTDGELDDLLKGG